MCYLFCRCTRSVSVVPPCYYAHLAAFRGRILVSEGMSDTETSVSSGSTGPTNVRLLLCHPAQFATPSVPHKNTVSHTEGTVLDLKGGFPSHCLIGIGVHSHECLLYTNSPFFSTFDVIIVCELFLQKAKMQITDYDLRMLWDVLQVECAKVHANLRCKMYYV